jgi:hypothetical protein
MIAEVYLSTSRLYRRLRNGSHGGLVEHYAARLVEVGLAHQRTWRGLKLVSDLLSWIASSRSLLTDLDERMVDRYLRHRARKQSIHPGDRVASARCWHDRAAGAVADHSAGPDIRRVRRLSATRTRFGIGNHHRASANDPPVSV